MTRPLVMPVLDPSIPAVLPTLGRFVDCLVTPGNDGHRAGS
jgi:hypothetical protein